MLDQFLTVFIPLFIIVNPASTLALFSVITNRTSKKDRVRTARNASLYAMILLIIFAVAGSGILGFLGIEIYSLRIAGGILLGAVGLDMLRRGEQFGESPPGKEQKADFALVPLALPSLSGPGAITITIVSMQSATWFSLQWWLVIIAIIITMVLTFLVFMSSIFVIKIMGRKGMDALTRVMGLLTVAIAVQFALTGLAGWIPTLSI
jgi:multiple antibiotic resistance protein